MRRLGLLSLVALLATALLATAQPAHAGTSMPVTSLGNTVNSPAIPRTVVVTKQYGAALRYAPDSDAAIYWNASCGDVFYVTDEWQGWYQIISPDYGGGYLWVGGARVADAANPPYFSCRYAVTYQMGDSVVSSVPSGCLSVRYYPSRQAPYDYCVPNGYRFTITNGPLEVDGEDWFQVRSVGTGYGWVLADYIRYGGY